MKWYASLKGMVMSFIRRIRWRRRPAEGAPIDRVEAQIWRKGGFLLLLVHGLRGCLFSVSL